MNRQVDYIYMIDIYGTLVQNDDLSRCFFCFFKILTFLVVRGGKRAKNGQKLQKIMSITLYFRNHTSFNCHLSYTCVKW